MLPSWSRLAPTLLLTLVVTCAIARAETTDTTIGAGIGTFVLDAFGDGSVTINTRLGGYTLGGSFGDARLTPFADMAGHWPSDGLYRACVERTVTDLARERLYDLRFRADVLGADAPRPSRPAP